MIRLARLPIRAGALVALGLWGVGLSTTGPALAGSPAPLNHAVAVPAIAPRPVVTRDDASLLPTVSIPESTTLALLGVGGLLLLAPYLRRKARAMA